MSLKGHVVQSGATSDLLKTERLKEHGGATSKKMTKEGAKILETSRRARCLFPIKMLTKSCRGRGNKEKKFSVRATSYRSQGSRIFPEDFLGYSTPVTELKHPHPCEPVVCAVACEVSNGAGVPSQVGPGWAQAARPPPGAGLEPSVGYKTPDPSVASTWVSSPFKGALQHQGVCGCCSLRTPQFLEWEHSSKCSIKISHGNNSTRNLLQVPEGLFAPRPEGSSPILGAAGQGLGGWCRDIRKRKAVLPGDERHTRPFPPAAESQVSLRPRAPPTTMKPRPGKGGPEGGAREGWG